MKKKVLVLGATGFIGQNMAVAFANKPDENEVVGTFLSNEPWQHPNVKFVQADLLIPEEVDRVMEGGTDILIQTAATTSGAKDTFNKPYYHVTDNAVINSLVLRAAYHHFVKHFIFFSCTNVYYPTDVPQKEEDLDLNRGMYDRYLGVGWTKIYIEKMCEFFAGLGRTKHTVIRHANMYGPHDRYDLERSHVFGASMTKVMTAKDKVVIWGHGNEKRDMLYISDVVSSVELVLEKQNNAYELYNIGSGELYSVNEMVRKIVEHSGKQIAIENDLTKPSLDFRVCLDSTKAEKELGWRKKVSFDEGIRKTVEWYRKNILKK